MTRLYYCKLFRTENHLTIQKYKCSKKYSIKHVFFLKKKNSFSSEQVLCFLIFGFLYLTKHSTHPCRNRGEGVKKGHEKVY